MKGGFRYVSGTTIPAFVFIVHSLNGLEDRLF
jgi:hypothetical protein